jgi:predicted TIM-barrel fold metal-dependent hydrolase
MLATPPIIDVNITLGHWPTRRVPLDDPQKLIAKLREHNVIEAWAGHYDGLFHPDLTAVNNRLSDECRAHTAMRLIPFGEINPQLPNWENEFHRCADHHRMAGVRLHPNYHGYKLDHPNFARLLKAAAHKDLIVQLAVLMEDDRMMHPLMRVSPVDLAPLPALLAQSPRTRVILLNALKGARNDDISRLMEVGELYIDISMLEGVGGLDTLLADVRADRILFGSHTPSLYFEAARLKLKESALPAPHLRAITEENARRLLPRKS